MRRRCARSDAAGGVRTAHAFRAVVPAGEGVPFRMADDAILVRVNDVKSRPLHARHAREKLLRADPAVFIRIHGAKVVVGNGRRRQQKEKNRENKAFHDKSSRCVNYQSFLNEGGARGSMPPLAFHLSELSVFCHGNVPEELKRIIYIKINLYISMH